MSYTLGKLTASSASHTWSLVLCQHTGHSVVYTGPREQLSPMNLLTELCTHPLNLMSSAVAKLL